MGFYLVYGLSFCIEENQLKETILCLALYQPYKIIILLVQVYVNVQIAQSCTSIFVYFVYLTKYIVCVIIVLSVRGTAVVSSTYRKGGVCLDYTNEIFTIIIIVLLIELIKNIKK